MTKIDKLLQQAEEALAKVAQQQKKEAAFRAKAQIRFEQNVEAFKKYYPNIATSIEDFEPRDDFKIIVTSTGQGNFIPKSSAYPLYSDAPLEQATEQVKKNTNKGYYSFTDYGFGSSTETGHLHIKYMSKLASLIWQSKKEDLPKISSLPSHFPSGVFFGVGLGYHLPILLSEHSFDYLFICEPDFEIFYASLYCTDWSELIEAVDAAGNTLFFQIGITYKEFFSTLYNLANDIGAFSLVRSFCYQHYPSVEVNELIKAFFERYFEIQSGFGFYNDAITGLAHTTLNLQQNIPLLVSNNKKYNFQKLPVYVVGNGPSLDSAEQLLKKNQDKVIIIAAGTALFSLLKMGITPDFHVLVERTKSTYDVLLDTLPLDIYEKLNLLTVDVMYADVPGLYHWAGMGLKGPEAGTVLVQWLVYKKYGAMMQSLPHCGPMVSNTALSFAVRFGFEEIYLLGIDNGSIENHTHSKHSIYNDKQLKYKTPMSSGAKYKLEGNLGKEVMATELLVISKNKIENLIASNKDRYFYNIGHGAKLEGAYALTEDDVLPVSKPIDKAKIVQEIKDIFFKDNLITVGEDDLNFEIFDDICDNLIEIADTPLTDRKSATDVLKRQARYVYAFRNSKYAHLFYMVKGSLLYYHCPMITLLYTYADEEISLHYFSEAMALWKSYIQAMKEDFRINYQTKCTMGLDVEKVKGK